MGFAYLSTMLFDKQKIKLRFVFAKWLISFVEFVRLNNEI